MREAVNRVCLHRHQMGMVMRCGSCGIRWSVALNLNCGVTSLGARSLLRMDQSLLDATAIACTDLIEQRYPDDEHQGAAAMLLDDGTILTGTAPHAVNPSVEVCHEIEPYCGAYRLNQSIVASICLHRQPGGRVVVLSPCGVCRERLAVHGPEVLVAVADPLDPTVIVWKRLKMVLPDYWMTAFPDEIDPAWIA